MTDFIIIVVVVVIVGTAARYVYKAKKSGRTCIGCPDGCNCSAKKDAESCGCGCGGSAAEE